MASDADGIDYDNRRTDPPIYETECAECGEVFDVPKKQTVPYLRGLGIRCPDCLSDD